MWPGGRLLRTAGLWVNSHQVLCTAYLLCPSSGSPQPSGTDMQDLYFWRMPEHDTAIQPNLAQSRQEVKRWNNIQLLFKIKKLCVDTSTQISKKRQPQALCWSFGQEHFVFVCLFVVSLFLLTQTYNCSREWLCDYRGNSSALWCQLSTVLHRGGLKPQPVGIARWRSKTGSEPQRSGPVSSGNWGSRETAWRGRLRDDSHNFCPGW